MNFLGIGKRNSLKSIIEIEPHAIRGAVVRVGRDGKPVPVAKKMISAFRRGASRTAISQKLHEFVFSLVRGLEQVPDHMLIGISPFLGKQKLELWNIARSHEGAEMSANRLETYFSNLVGQHQTADAFSFAYPTELFFNGYSVGAPLLSDRNVLKADGPAKEIGFKTVTMTLSQETGSNIFGVQKSLGGLPITFIPLVAAYEKAFVEALALPDSFLIEIGTEYTSLVMLKEGKLANFVSFPCGTEHFSSAMAKKLGVPIEEAEDLRRNYATGVIDEKRRVMAQEALLGALETWQKLFLEHLNFFYVNGPLPSTVCVFGEGANLLEVISLLRNSSWMKDFSYAASPTLRIIEGQSIFEGDTLKGVMRGSEEVRMAALLWYSLHHKPLINLL